MTDAVAGAEDAGTPTTDAVAGAVRELRVAITGHRPGGLHDASGRPIDLVSAVSSFVAWIDEKAAMRGYGVLTVITGGALGVDQEVAAAIERLRDAPAGARSMAVVRSCVVLPFPPEVLGARWRAADVERLRGLAARADEVVGPLYEVYSVGGLHARNHRMVDAADIVVGFWNGTRSGGTYACLRYALARGKPMLNALAGMRRISEGDLVAA